MMLQTGIKGKSEMIVSDSNTAKAMQSGNLSVFATPAVIALMEKTAFESVSDYLEDGCVTVGTLVHAEHLAATPVGMKVYCESELVEIEGRKLVFELSVYDDKELIAKGRHERFIVRKDRFMEKVLGKNS